MQAKDSLHYFILFIYLKLKQRTETSELVVVYNSNLGGKKKKTTQTKGIKLLEGKQNAFQHSSLEMPSHIPSRTTG